MLHADAPHDRIVLDFSNDTRQQLDPAGNPGDGLYSNSAYAWRSNGAGFRLTDITNIEAFDCARSGNAS